jgi:hypothetical protein
MKWQLSALSATAAVRPALALLILTSTMAFSGCIQGREDSKSVVPEAAASPLAQDQICVTSEVRVESDCRPGQRVVFMPGRWGNEQLPVMFAAMNCDLRYTVAMTQGGVTCVFFKARQPDAPAAAASGPAPAASTGGP